MVEMKKLIGSARHKERVGEILGSLDLSSIRGKNVLVTGGGGFVGIHLARSLHMIGCSVVIMDKREPAEDYHSDIQLVQGDICDKEFVNKICEGKDCVFHTASVGISVDERWKLGKFLDNINIGGTENVIEACITNNVPRMVYTSSINVVLGKKPFDNISEEDLPRIDPKDHSDDYSRTKTVAEILVINANGRKLQDGGTLHTCAIRPPGIYGAGEQRHMNRLVPRLPSYKVNFGSSSTMTNWVHVDNLVNGHILAAEGLSANKDRVAAGQAYYITDKEPVNNSLFMKPLITGLGYPFPNIWIPYTVLHIIFSIMEVLLTLLRPFLYLVPPIHSGEVGSSTVDQMRSLYTNVSQIALHHTVSYKKAERDLGYRPLHRDLEDVVEHLRQLGHQRKTSPKTAGGWSTTIKIVLVIAVIAVAIAMLM